MRKKRIICFVSLVIIAACWVTWKAIIQEKDKNSSLLLKNVEILAKPEFTDDNPPPDCVPAIGWCSDGNIVWDGLAIEGRR